MGRAWTEAEAESYAKPGRMRREILVKTGPDWRIMGGMVDRVSRPKAAALLKKLALGRITTDEFEIGLWELKSKDPVLVALDDTIAEMAGDQDPSLAPAFARGTEMRKRVCRWILFLRTDLDYLWPAERMAPGIRDFYRPAWYDKLFRLDKRMLKSNIRFFAAGDYEVWPFLRKGDFERVRQEPHQTWKGA